MVEKRTLLFASLLMFVLAMLTSSLAGYFYLQNAVSSEQNAENLQSIDAMATRYNDAMTKYNKLLSDYSMLYGSYSLSQDTDFTLPTDSLNDLLDHAEGNFSSLLASQKDLNETCYELRGKCQALLARGNVTREEFGELLNELYELLNLLVIRELNSAMSEVTTLAINMCIDYGNETVKWYNNTDVSPGSSLFQAIQKVATVNYTYYAWMKPGHIRLTAINDKEEYAIGYSEGWSWIWYYWNDDLQQLVSGPVGCDAWMLKDGGTYKWRFEHWSWP
ncbi:MAG: hypothetical protein OEY22_00120 [Candidatus Bathyarchaeota archaeon]|nr:hypothetical protein [Candidatus Bathyarchaeota archaeon]MDH5788770.1 hypothetical protein [Candidatus Bathyarchaeota archaeon]